MQEKYHRIDHTTMVNGPSLAGFTIQHNTAFSTFIINSRLLILTPTEYELALPIFELVSQQQREGIGQSNSYLSYEVLEDRVGLSRRVIVRHICSINGKLLHTGIQVVRVGCYGYTLVFEREQEQRAGNFKNKELHPSPYLHKCIG